MPRPSHTRTFTAAPRVRSLVLAVPERLDALVAALLEKEPSVRPQTAAEVRAALVPPPEEATGPNAHPTQPLSRPEPTSRLSEERPRSLPRWIRPAAAAALIGVLLLFLLPVLFAGDRKPGAGAGPAATRSQESSSPTTHEPSSPPAQPLSSGEAAQHVLDVVNEGVAAGEISGGIVGEIQHQIDEAIKELEDHEDLEKALDKISELRSKVSDALEKGEITSPSRAQAIDDALDALAAAIAAEAEE